MYYYLHQYFAANKKLVLPGIGSFIAASTPAELDFINRSLKAPAASIAFHPGEATEDESFAAFLAAQTNDNVASSKARFRDFTEALVQNLKNGKEANLQGIGSLQLTGNEVRFTPDNAVQDFFPAVTAAKIVRQNATHTIKVGEDEKTSEEMHELLHTATKQEKWWVTALILAAIGVAAIAWHYLRK